MSIPNPFGELEGHCAAIYDDTLYVYSPTGLQSLPIKKKAEWSKEASGVAVTGPACVKVGDGASAALYVIGGSSDDTTFSGLQRYTFSTKQWETLSSASSKVIKQRTKHSVAYIAESESILVYAGSQPSAPSEYSSQTFLISTKSPYNIDSFTSHAPPTSLPILLSWTNSSAIMMGGAPDNTQIWTFSSKKGWNEYGTNLTDAPSSATRGSIIQGAGRLKVLELYDAGVSPNVVSQIVLQDSDGRPAQDNTTVGTGASSRKRKRALTLKNWPTYDSKDAPTATRTDYSLSQSSDGLAIIAGGSSTDPIAMFNQDDNSWIDASTFFDSAYVSHSSSSSSKTATATASATSAAATSSTSSSNSSGGVSHQTLKLLGIILGVLLGIAAIFIIALLYFRHRRIQRRRREAAEFDEKSGQRMSFQDRGASFMKEAGGSVNELQPPRNEFSRFPGGSHSSLAIIAGKISSKRNTPTHAPKSSFDSTVNLVRDKEGELGEPVEMMAMGGETAALARKPVANGESRYGPSLTVEDSDAKARRKRSSGWSKYFATSGPTGPDGVSHLPDAYAKRQSASGLIPPLEFNVDKSAQGQLSHVATGSPAISDSGEGFAKSGHAPPMPEAQAGLIVTPRPRSQSDISSYTRSTVSSMVSHDYYNSDVGHLPWGPTNTAMFKDQVNSTAANGGARPPSSMYSTSVYEPRTPYRKKSSGFFPGAGTTYRPTRRAKNTPSDVSMLEWPQPPRNTDAGTNGREAAAATLSGTPATGAAGSSSDGPAVPSTTASMAAALRPRDSDLQSSRSSAVTAFPRGVSSAYYAAGRPRERDSSGDVGKGPISTDLTWLDLGSGGNGSKGGKI